MTGGAACALVDRSGGSIGGASAGGAAADVEGARGAEALHADDVADGVDFFFVARLGVEPTFALGFFAGFFGACGASRVSAPADAGADGVAGDDVELALVAAGALVVAAVTRPGVVRGPACVSDAAVAVAELAGAAVTGLPVAAVAGLAVAAVAGLGVPDVAGLVVFAAEGVGAGGALPSPWRRTSLFFCRRMSARASALGCRLLAILVLARVASETNDAAESSAGRGEPDARAVGAGGPWGGAEGAGESVAGCGMDA
ncbi:hypothetical protein PF007_g24896 [Phytophthora fragariae]|uniref:Uncharacterized protein n=1 Tax=Phytophthora fragariae TaxID=53985 RepID=A0A6A3DTV4_9STRA|nr:hypothetical protein PF009_g26482 [Phytophthora fragariae]KAE9075705.1 hypothetical protein PF007_g24896 [Phytophthora fragariae]KAE9088021.1 hypothetical protein PF006_g25676 [Phytophthora fragariae]